jgi:hypothetical protein
LNSFHKGKQPTKLMIWKYWVGYVKLCVLILHHDNAQAYTELCVKQFLAQKSITEMGQLPYSPDFAPNDFWLLPKIKCALKIRRFQDIEDIQKNLTTSLKAIPH